MTAFSVQHKQIKYIFNRHWKVLKNDRVLGPALPDRAAVIYRGTPSLRGQIAPNVIDPPTRPSFFHNLKGYYPCCKCNVCVHNACRRRKSKTFESTSTSAIYQMKHCTTYATHHIVYLITCPCKKQLLFAICGMDHQILFSQGE